MRGLWVFAILAGWLAVVPFGDADIVWSGIQNQRAALDITDFDVNLDGVVDFVFSWDDFTQGATFDPVAGNSGIGMEYPYIPGIYDYVPLSAGFVVEQPTQDPSMLWWDGSDYLLASGLFGEEIGYSGSFAQTNGYMGISFSVDNSIHYGWIHMSHDENLSSPNNFYLFVDGWAWETEADTPIVTGAIPEPSSGVLVVFGALSLWQFRRSHRRKYCSTPGR